MTLSTGAGSEVMAGKQVILLLELLYSCPLVSIRGSDLFSIDASKVADASIRPQVAFTE